MTTENQVVPSPRMNEVRELVGVMVKAALAHPEVARAIYRSCALNEATLVMDLAHKHLQALEHGHHPAMEGLL